jgi:hypothetical protein
MAIHNTKEMDFVMQPGEEDKAMEYDSDDSDEPLPPRKSKMVHKVIDEDSDDSDDLDEPLRPRYLKTVHNGMDEDSYDSDDDKLLRPKRKTGHNGEEAGGDLINKYRRYL